MSIEFIAFLGIGTTAMFLTMLFGQRKRRRVALLKLPIAAILLTAVGVFGAKIMFFVESGRWGGTSFFGAVFLAPVLMAAVALLLRVHIADLLDLCAPAECVMLAILKVQCFLVKCCGGRTLWQTGSGVTVVFPSQIAELCNALVLMAVLLLLMRKETMRGKIYPMYMVLYGGTRFCLNLLRETTPFLLGLPAGNFWSLISIFIGGVWLLMTRRSQGDRNEKHTESIA